MLATTFERRRLDNLLHRVFATDDNRSMPSLQSASPEFLDTAPLRVVTEATVMAPVSECWSLLADQASWVQWFDGMTAVHATPWIWTEPGQTRTVTINGLNVQETAISLEPEREYAFTITKWPLPNASMVAEGVRLEDRTNLGSPRTKLTYIGAIESTTIGKPAEGLLEKQLSNAWATALRRLGELAARRASTDG